MTSPLFPASAAAAHRPIVVRFERRRAAGVLVEADGRRRHLDIDARQDDRRRARGRIANGVAVAGARWAIAG